MKRQRIAVYSWDNDDHYQRISSILASCRNVDIIRCQDIDNIKSTDRTYLLLTVPSNIPMEQNSTKIKNLIIESGLQISDGLQHIVKVIVMEFANESNMNEVVKNAQDLENLLAEHFSQGDIMLLNSLPKIATYMPLSSTRLFDPLN